MDTIAAISTPRGVGGIGVIRISGSEAIEIADKIFEGIDGKKLSSLRGYCTKFGRVVENGKPIDEVIAAVFRTPHSYTGEDVVEISCHGGIFITSEVLRIIIAAGATPAAPGEFTKRAFLNNKMSITQAEAVMELISAKGRLAAGIAFSAKNGEIQQRVLEIKENLSEVLAPVMANIDYPEEDIPQIDDELLKQRLSDAKNKIQKLIESSRAGKIVKEGVVTAIIGKPNVGKSTLMNLLSGCEKSIVTSIPGTTRDIIEDTVMVGDIPLLLSDTAGIHESGDEIEKIGILRAEERIKSSELIIAVFDGSRELTNEDTAILQRCDKRSIAVINKSDLPLKIDKNRIKNFTDYIVEMSAKEGRGKDDFQQTLYRMFNALGNGESEAVMFNERIFSGLNKAYDGINRAINELKAGMGYDIIAYGIEEGVKELRGILGEDAGKNMADEIFSRFCVGK